MTLEDMRDTVLARLALDIRVLPNGCWEWMRSKNTKGYGEVTVLGEKWIVTRLMLTLHVRRLRPGELACHVCDWPPCCNPVHLFIGDKAINAVDKVEKGTNHYRQKTHCQRGHSYAEHGYEHAGSRNGRPWRSCKLCSRISQRLRAGWPKHLAETMGKTPNGYRPVGGSFKSASGSEGPK